MANEKTAAKKVAPKKVATPAAEKTGGSSKSFFYVVYVDAYRDDTTIVPRGVYRTSKAIPRFDAMSSKFVEKFEGKIPDGKLHTLAKSLRVSAQDEAGDYRDSADILAEIVQELA